MAFSFYPRLLTEPCEASALCIETISLHRFRSQSGILRSESVALPPRDLGGSCCSVGLGLQDRICSIGLGRCALSLGLGLGGSYGLVGFRQGEPVGIRLSFCFGFRLGQGVRVGYRQRVRIGFCFRFGISLEFGNFTF